MTCLCRRIHVYDRTTFFTISIMPHGSAVDIHRLVLCCFLLGGLKNLNLSYNPPFRLPDFIPVCFLTMAHDRCWKPQRRGVGAFVTLVQSSHWSHCPALNPTSSRIFGNTSNSDINIFQLDLYAVVRSCSIFTP